MSTDIIEPKLVGNIHLDTDSSMRMSGALTISPSLAMDVESDGPQQDFACQRLMRILERRLPETVTNVEQLMNPEKVSTSSTLLADVGTCEDHNDETQFF